MNQYKTRETAEGFELIYDSTYGKYKISRTLISSISLGEKYSLALIDDIGSALLSVLKEGFNGFDEFKNSDQYITTYDLDNNTLEVLRFKVKELRK